MALMVKARPLLVLSPLVLGGVQLVGGVEQLAGSVSVTASKYDTRSNTAADEFKGCYTDGCAPDLMLDGFLNETPESRWSCEEALVGTITECYATFDLGSPFALSKLSMWFHESFDEERESRAFVVSISDDGSAFTESFAAENTVGLAVGVADDFTFPAGSSGQYVRVTGVLLVDQWLSINEVEVYVDVETPAPVPATTAPVPSTAAPTTAPVPTTPEPTVAAPTPNATATPNPAAIGSTAAPTVEVYVDVNATTPAPAAASTIAPVVSTPSPTVVGGAACANITVSNIGDLNGEYSRTDGASEYVSTGPNAATIAASETQAECGDASATVDCTVQRWQIKPVDSASTLPTYVVYDEAAHPSDIAQVWLRLDSCSTSGCTSSPADVDILCSDGSTAGLATPAPVSATSSSCGVIEVAGTSGAVSDGFYYDEGNLADEVARYQGYDAVNGELTSNGNSVLAKRVESTCTTSATSASADACSWRQWWIEPESSVALDYYAFAEADHPVDIPPSTLWYTSNLTVVPFDGDVTITCATDAPPLGETTPAPSVSGTGNRGIDDDATDDSATRAPVDATTSPADGAEVDGAGQESDGGGDSNTGVIAGSVAGGVALLAIAGVVAYKLKKTPPPPPSYDDLVGSA
eukprot:g15676.t1